jgi:hypothetical protein
MDELFKAILMDAMKNGMKPVEKNKVQEMKEQVTDTAKLAKMQYDQFLAVGFNEDQAMQLTIAVFN